MNAYVNRPGSHSFLSSNHPNHSHQISRVYPHKMSDNHNNHNQRIGSILFYLFTNNSTKMAASEMLVDGLTLTIDISLVLGRSVGTWLCSVRQIPDSGVAIDPNLIKSQVPRFCDPAHGPRFRLHFRLVFHNKTFRVYEVLWRADRTTTSKSSDT